MLVRSTACAAIVLASFALGVSADQGRTLHLRAQVPARIRIEGGFFTTGMDDAVRAEVLRVCALDLPPAAPCDASLLADERPRKRLYLRAFEIDRNEVSNADYRRCVAALSCLPARSSDADPAVARPDHPVTELSWGEAEQYCRFRSGHLPTEAQWERAARGGSSRTFPWGRHWNHRLANAAPAGSAAARAGSAPVSAYAAGRSFHGLLNMAGNVWEFVADDDAAPHAEEPSSHVVRGGSWRSPPHLLRVSARARVGAGERRADVGFRCAYEAAPSARRADPP